MGKASVDEEEVEQILANVGERVESLEHSLKTLESYAIGQLENLQTNVQTVMDGQTLMMDNVQVLREDIQTAMDGHTILEEDLGRLKNEVLDSVTIT